MVIKQDAAPGSGFNPEKQKAVHPIWVEHCLAEKEALHVSKRYDASLWKPLEPESESEPRPAAVRSNLIDSDSDDDDDSLGRSTSYGRRKVTSTTLAAGNTTRRGADANVEEEEEEEEEEDGEEDGDARKSRVHHWNRMDASSNSSSSDRGIDKNSERYRRKMMRKQRKAEEDIKSRRETLEAEYREGAGSEDDDDSIDTTTTSIKNKNTSTPRTEHSGARPTPRISTPKSSNPITAKSTPSSHNHHNHDEGEKVKKSNSKKRAIEEPTPMSDHIEPSKKRQKRQEGGDGHEQVTDSSRPKQSAAKKSASSKVKETVHPAAKPASESRNQPKPAAKKTTTRTTTTVSKDDAVEKVRKKRRNASNGDDGAKSTPDTLTSRSKSSPPAEEPAAKFLVYISKLVPAEKAKWEKKVGLVDEVTFVKRVEEATHVISFGMTAPVTFDQVSPSITTAVAQGKWVLTPEWLEKIAETGEVPLNLEDYECVDFIPGCRAARLAHKRRKEYLASKGLTEEDVEMDDLDKEDPDLPGLLFDDWTFNLDNCAKAAWHFSVQIWITGTGGHISHKLNSDVWITEKEKEIFDVRYQPRQGPPQEDLTLQLQHPEWKKRHFDNVHSKSAMKVWVVTRDFMRDSILSWQVADIDAYPNFLKTVQALGYGSKKYT